MSELSPTLSSKTAPACLSPTIAKTEQGGSPMVYLAGLNRYVDAGTYRPVAIVVKTGTDVGWYEADGDSAFLPLAEFLAHFGDKAFSETIRQRTSYHWDSGYPDTYKMEPKYTVVGYPADTDVTKLCRKGLESLLPKGEQDRLKESRAMLVRLATAWERAASPERGKTAEVVKGRKVPVGTKGEIIWVGAGDFGTRVGLRDEEGITHWTAADNIKVFVDGDDLIY